VKATLADRCVYVVARVAIGLAARVPQWLGYGVADLLGRLFFRLDGRRRGYALRFLRNAYPDRSERELLRVGARATGNLFMVPLDMARLTRLLARGGDLRTVLDYGQAGVHLAGMTPPYLGLTAHLGNWEVAAIAVAQHAGGDAHGVARVSKNPLLQQWLLHNRERGGLVIHPRRGGVRDLANALRRGRVGLQVVDQNQRLRAVFAPFFGEIASCERAAVSLALRGGYAIIVGGALRRGRGFRFELVAAPPFTLVATGDREADLVAGVTRVNAAIESLIRMAPEQYLWIHDRYRTRPQHAGASEEGDEVDDPAARAERAARRGERDGLAGGGDGADADPGDD
jgi:KDO2-lipid IV(A) lauroyltransferase